MITIMMIMMEKMMRMMIMMVVIESDTDYGKHLTLRINNTQLHAVDDLCVVECR